MARYHQRMHRLSAYIFGQLGKTVVFATVVLVLVGCSLYSQRYLSDIIEHGLPLMVFGDLILFMVPTMLVVMLPVTLAGSVMFIYGKLTEDSEMTVAQACGVSHWALVMPAVIAAMLGTATSYVMALHFIPQSMEVFQDIREELRNTRVETLLQEGVFNEVAPGLTIFFADRGGEGVLRNILIHDQSSGDRPATVIAERAVLGQTVESLTVQLQDGLVQRGSGDADEELTMIRFDSYTFDVDLTRLFGRGRIEPIAVQEMSLADLFQPPPEIRPGSEAYRERLSEGHQRLATPLLCLTLTLAAAAAVTGTHHRRHHRVRLLAVGAMIGLLVLAYHGAVVAARSNLLFVPVFYLLVIVPSIIAIGAILVSDGRLRALLPAVSRGVRFGSATPLR